MRLPRRPVTGGKKETSYPPRDSQVVASVTIGTRVMVAIVVVAGVALGVSGLFVWLLGQNSISSDVNAQLERSRDRFKALVEQGVDPDTGAPFSEPSQAVYAYIRQSVLGPDEAELGFVGSELTLLPPTRAALTPEDDQELISHLESHVTGDKVVIEDIRTSQARYRVMVAPTRTASGSAAGAALVHVVNLDTAHADLRRTMVMYMASAVFTVALVAALAWFAVERLLRPIGQLREATEAIGENDLTSRVPVRGRDDLTTLAVAINWMLDRVQRSVEAQRDLLDDVGHELRTPITVVRGHLELLDPDDAEDVAQTRELAIDEVDRMGTLVNDLLLLADVSETGVISPQQVDVSVLTQQVFEKAQGLGDRRWQLEEVAGICCEMDPTRITQAWLQLAANAVKYSDPGSRVSLGSRVDGASLLMWVRDEGIGIAEEDLPLVRRRFGRTAAAVQKASGTGLGLSIVDSIAVAHHGCLEIRSFQGLGSLFTLRLPLHTVADHATSPRKDTD
ncbi:sensor histidine kinase [Actinomyces sp. 2119]|uniref:sensor histidine kinase n=1 Tax=Actinomyces sp. 2119 TaxID=2321393 RepID=UPI000E6C5D73|nr:HAMP domain-containing sensor histidine kinase [Actinomyces sp. 2119]RJF42498.1 sensor histidine kinase [Actinomyces sp. 2119]